MEKGDGSIIITMSDWHAVVCGNSNGEISDLKIISAVESNIFSICSVQRDCQSNTVIANELTASFL